MSPRKSPRVAPADGGGAFLFNASPRVAPDGVPVRTQASPRVPPIGAARHRASPSAVAPGGALSDASPRQPDAAAGFWSRLSPREKSPRIAPADGGGAFLFNASPRVAPEGVPVRTQASPRVPPIGAARHRASPSAGIAPDASPRPQGASRDEAAGFWSRLSPQKSPRISPAGGGEILLQASPRIAPEGLPVQSQASRVSPRVAPDV